MFPTPAHLVAVCVVRETPASSFTGALAALVLQPLTWVGAVLMVWAPSPAPRWPLAALAVSCLEPAIALPPSLQGLLVATLSAPLVTS